MWTLGRLNSLSLLRGRGQTWLRTRVSQQPYDLREYISSLWTSVFPPVEMRSVGFISKSMFPKIVPWHTRKPYSMLFFKFHNAHERTPRSKKPPQGRNLLNCISLPKLLDRSTVFRGLCILAVLVCLGCCNKIPSTGWLINTHLCLTVLKSGSLRSWSGSGENLLGFRLLTFHYALTRWEEGESSGPPFIRALSQSQEPHS